MSRFSRSKRASLSAAGVLLLPFIAPAADASIVTWTFDGYVSSIQGGNSPWIDDGIALNDPFSLTVRFSDQAPTADSQGGSIYTLLSASVNLGAQTISIYDGTGQPYVADQVTLTDDYHPAAGYYIDNVQISAGTRFNANEYIVAGLQLNHTSFAGPSAALTSQIPGSIPPDPASFLTLGTLSLQTVAEDSTPLPFGITYIEGRFSPVPLPGSVWLLTSGLGLLFGRKRQREAVAG